MAEAEKNEFDVSWRGSSLKEVYRHLDAFDLQHFRQVEISPKSTVLYEFPIGVLDYKKPPKPFIKKDKHDSLHVRLPNSLKCQCPTYDNNECKTTHTKIGWELINAALSTPINNVQDLKNAILMYNQDFKDQWHFGALHRLFEDEQSADATEEFFCDLLPSIIKLALQLPHLIQMPIPFLNQNQNTSISLTQQQVSCLLANAFLCTFPLQSSVERWQPKHSKYKTFPEINFQRLFQSSAPAATEKIKCLLHYFRRVCPTESDCTNVPTGVVTFIRQCIYPEYFPEWSESKAVLGETIFHIDSKAVIEDGAGLLQVDFANKYIGGDVLGFGCAQEEIRFVINPELIVAKLFTECLLPNEALFMIGCEQYSNYSGYSSSFKWTGDHIDKSPRDSSKRRKVHIVAMDALHFRETKEQYREDLMLRELNKAYTGFWYELAKPAPGIATGNWGCGALRGDPRLKALLQLMVACVTDRPLAYFTFFDEELRDDIFKMFRFLTKRKTCVCDLWNILKEFESQNMDPKELYRYIQCRLREQI